MDISEEKWMPVLGIMHRFADIENNRARRLWGGMPTRGRQPSLDYTAIYDLHDRRGMTAADIGRELGCSGGHVARILRKRSKTQEEVLDVQMTFRSKYRRHANG